jgi:uncharacterized protein (DUF305 family)
MVSGVLLFAAALILAGGWLHQARHGNHEPAPHPIDIGFVQSMAVHHRQAIAMSQLMLDGRPTPLATQARSIAYAQLLELGEMQGWLKLWEQPLVPRALIMDWMLLGEEPPSPELRQYLIDCERSPTGMPGLATTAEMEALRASSGRARDELFLKMMLAHHRGGIPMARFATRHARLKVVRDLAARIVLDQSQEIYRMERTLAAMAASLSSD